MYMMFIINVHNKKFTQFIIVKMHKTPIIEIVFLLLIYNFYRSMSHSQSIIDWWTSEQKPNLNLITKSSAVHLVRQLEWIISHISLIVTAEDPLRLKYYIRQKLLCK